MAGLGSGKTAADWLAELADLGLVRASGFTVVALEKLLRGLRQRGVRDPVEIANSVAALLAKDDDRYQKIRDHFLRSFRGEQPRMPASFVAPTLVATPNRSPPKTPQSVSSAEPVSRWAPLVPLVQRMQRFGRWVGGRWWIALGIVLVSVGGLFGPKEFVTIVDPSLVKPVAFAHAGVAQFVDRVLHPPKPTSACVAQPPTIELVSAPPAVHTTEEPRGSSRPEPLWLFVVLGLSSLVAGLVAACWWFLDRQYARDRAQAQAEAKRARAAVIGDTKVLGALYDVDRAPPIDLAGIDDAATLLGRLARPDTGYDLDVPRTIDETIAAGGRVKPVFAPSGHRDALLVWVDIEEGAHPYLDGVEWLLDRWKRLGVPFVRYNFRGRPTLLEKPSDKRAIPLDKLGRRTEGMPLLVFSRWIMPLDFRGNMPWLEQLEPWPVRAWIDLNPHGAAEARGEIAPMLPRIEKRLARYPLTKTGLVQAATMLARRGQTPPQKKEASVDLNDPAVERALAWWAGAAACVPHPTWVHLDDLRRLLPEVHDVLSCAADVQFLIDYTRRRDVGEGDVGEGPQLRFSDEGRRILLKELREADTRTFGPDNPKATVEYRVRARLIRQLEKARLEADAFGEANRAMKMDVHKAAIGEKDIPALIEEHGKGPAAAELEPLLRELEWLQEAKQPGPTQQPWTHATEDVVHAWLGALHAARAADLVRVRAWSPPLRLVLAVGALLVANVATLVFVRPWRRSVEQTIEMAAAFQVVIPDEPPALCDVAPMPFVKIPAGEFVMGSPESEKDRDDDEKQHRVQVGAFEMATKEVTQKQWTTVMGTTPFDCEYVCSDDRPANRVSMYDAMKFLNKLTDRENQGKPLEQQRTRCYDETNWSWDRACTGYRLPTEGEWEYAARAGTTTAYSFGDEAKDLCTYGNGADIAAKRKHANWTPANEACDDGESDLAPVGKYKPNPWGLYDMHGNVYEWVWDKYATYSDKPLTNDSDKPDDHVTDADRRVLRGGSAVVVARGLRSANRNGILPSHSILDVGFRCVRGGPVQH